MQHDKIQRLSTWKKQNGVGVTIAESEVKDREESSNHSGDERLKKIQNCQFKLIWDYDAANPPLNEVAPDGLLAELEGLTGCKFLKDLSLSKIFIGSFLEEDGRHAMRRLDNIRKAWVSTIALQI